MDVVYCSRCLASEKKPSVNHSLKKNKDVTIPLNSARSNHLKARQYFLRKDHLGKILLTMIHECSIEHVRTTSSGYSNKTGQRRRKWTVFLNIKGAQDSIPRT